MPHSILSVNPESFRNWQERNHQDSLIDKEMFAVCVSCSEDIPASEEVHLYNNKYCCEECIINEMQEEGKTRDEAIETFKQFALKYRK